MAATREIGPWGPPQRVTESERSRYNDLARPGERRGHGWGWKIAGLTALALVVAVGISVWPDIKRYMKIRNM
jgi:hypothetical protein